MANQENEHRIYKDYLDSLPGIFYVFDKTRFIEWNKQWEIVSGYSSDEISKMYALDFFDGADKELIAEKMKEVFTTGSSEAEAEFITKQGKKIPYYFTGSRKELNGKLYLVGLGIDISERKEAEKKVKRTMIDLMSIKKELEESDKRFMDVLYASDDAILLIDQNIFVDCNNATARMLNYSTREEFMNTHPSKLSPEKQPDGRMSFEKAEDMMKIAMEKGFHRFEWMHRKSNEEDFPVEVSLTPVPLHGKTVIHCVWRDLTKIKEIEE
ncbi:MAG: PAS domain-containing protein, partial [Candidatus Omnitrophica bacterium]|nr:PAS domain-containing protein [Candidatus Omnitrophota bacterium]